MVRATFAGFSTALSALQANQKRLDITGQNLANMNTVGYTRQQLETSSLNYTNPVSHYMSVPNVNVGFGVSMDRVSQIRDPYLDAQYRTQMSKSNYTNTIQTSLDTLSRFLDESDINGIRAAFDDIQSVFTNLQDTPNANDAVFESELRSRMQALTNLLNDAARQITQAEKDEFTRLDGKGTSEKGASQRVNEILQQIGDLNVQIKRNQIVGQPSLELQDERNVLLDELAGYVPIEITYYKDSDHCGTYTDANGNTRDKMYDYDSNGNIIGKREWPDDLRVDMVYTDNTGATSYLTLVNGTEGGKGKNYGSIQVIPGGTADDPDPLGTTVKFNGFTNNADDDVTITSKRQADQTAAEGSLKDGSIQASLDMLHKRTATDPDGVNVVRGYEYYMSRLDTLAASFANVMNTLNNIGNDQNGNNTPGNELLVNKTLPSDDPTGITAANIGISQKWVGGSVHIGKDGESFTDTILNMLEAMNRTYPVKNPSNTDFNNFATTPNLENKTFADYMNNISTILANDSLSNQTALKTNVTVLNGIQDSRDSVSGVSLDEEATNMMAYISAYNAASRLMTTLDEALNTLINNTGLVGR